MRVTVTAVSPTTRRRADVVIDADPDTPVAEIATGLDSILNGGVLSRACFGARAAGHPAPLTAPVVQQGSKPRLFTAGQRVPSDARFADSLIRDGSVISLGDPSACPHPERAGVAEIRVVAGPAAGRLHRLPFGEADIGGPAPGDTEVVIADPSVPRSRCACSSTPKGSRSLRSTACKPS
jgi:DNA segregation ATPase FtsK/SpoIIIE, S-DNA-T family